MPRKLLLTHELAELYFTEETLYLEEIWSRNTMNTNDSAFKSYQEIKLKTVKEHLPKLFFCDTSSFFYAMSSEMQEWTDDIVMKFWDNSPLEKLAFLSSREFLSAMSVKLAMEIHDHNYPIKYFKDENAAKEWLFAN